MANNRSRRSIEENDATRAIVAEIARIMTISAVENHTPQSKDIQYNEQREAFFERMKMKENDLVVARWKAFRLECVAAKLVASKITFELLREKRIFDFNSRNLNQLVSSDSSATVLTDQTTKKITNALQDASTNASEPAQSSAKVTAKRPIEVMSAEALTSLIKDDASIITDLAQENAAKVRRAMQYVTFFDNKLNAMKNRADALTLREQSLSSDIAKINAVINQAKGLSNE